LSSLREQELERNRSSDDRGVQNQTNAVNHSLRQNAETGIGEPGARLLSGIFRMAVDYDEIPQNPCRKVQLLPENNQRTRHLSFDEEHRLFAELTGEREYLQPLVTVAIYAGPRRGELLKLRWAHMDFDLNTITFKETKTNKDRSVPMEPIVRRALLELRERADDAEYVFVNPDTGTRYTDVKKSFSAACRKASITDFRFHDLRHTFGIG
jgi:integrase